MTDHPVTPPPELMQQWLTEFYGAPVVPGEACTDFAIRAAQWGADQELEACCEWLHWQNLATHPELIPSLRAARRPKPPSLKEQALTRLDYVTAIGEDKDLIRRALEALPNE